VANPPYGGGFLSETGGIPKINLSSFCRDNNFSRVFGVPIQDKTYPTPGLVYGYVCIQVQENIYSIVLSFADPNLFSTLFAVPVTFLNSKGTPLTMASVTRILYQLCSGVR